MILQEAVRVAVTGVAEDYAWNFSMTVDETRRSMEFTSVFYVSYIHVVLCVFCACASQM